MSWCVKRALRVEENTGEKARLGCACLTAFALAILHEQRLHFVPDFAIQNRLMLAGIGLFLVAGQANIERVVQHLIKRTAEEMVAFLAVDIVFPQPLPEAC